VIRVRFAPSPTGLLHVGNARTALFNWLLARGAGGRFVLRIEDTDAERSTDASASAILDDLRWLGLDWNEGPDIGGAYGPYRQSERLPLYRSHADRLIESGAAYRCFCTADALESARAAAIAAGQVPRYVGTCRAVPPDAARARAEAGESFAVRFRVPDVSAVRFTDVVRGTISTETTMLGDFVLLRQSGLPAYNFAVVVDDALMAITDVIRGEDHVSNTPRQVLLYEALGYDAPRFAHVSLVMGPDHAPLSKRHGATSVGEFRQQGILPEALVNYLALLGWSPGQDEELLPIDELARRFRVEDVSRSASVFDPGKLAWMNRHYQRAADPDRLTSLIWPVLETAGYVTTDTPAARAFVTTAVLPMVTGAVDRLADVPARVASVFTYPEGESLEAAAEALVADTPEARGVVTALAQALSGHARLTRETYREVAQAVRQHTGVKGRALFHTIRVALTGCESGPELDLLIPAIEGAAEAGPRSGVAAVDGCRERAMRFHQVVARLARDEGAR
jgi:glutamyl-tRNA synthetase/nondiscriminating glutamyl-tRNA synthetase